MRSLASVTVVLAYLAAVLVLHPVTVAFDGLSFLMRARAGEIDYGHALYLPLLRAAQAVAGEGAAPERVAQVVSSIGAALAFALLWRRIERGGAPRILALLVAACFGLATLTWQEAGSIEPSSWTTAALLVAAEAAEAYARRATWGRMALAVLALEVAVGLHLVSLCAAPWLVSLAWKKGAAPPALHLLVPLGGVVLALALALLGGELGAHLRYWSGFVPDLDRGVWSELEWHLQRGGRLFLEGAPVLLALSIVAAAALSWTKARGGAEGAWLGASYLLAYLVLGKPLVGLLMPVILAAALVVGRVAALERGPPRAAVALVLALSAALQLALTLPQALEWRRGPDVNRTRAELLVRHLPEGARLFAGSLTNHLRYYWPAVDVVSLPQLWHEVHARDRSADPIEVVRGEVERADKRCLLSSDGAGFLMNGLHADLTRLGLSLEAALPVPEDPKLALFPLDTAAQRAGGTVPGRE